ncbi:VPA1262 family N-terminal domain-containing protein [Sorangium sp. So ce128]|uniref:VPA1262 family N-terminal domain-containing protein n=1 Tax=Sorangium sp. So ce128 TaxID=3133281 RepID=UPI003F5EC0FD
MAIQEVTAQPSHPLATLESDYSHAVVHLAWDLHKRTKERVLLFGLVELLPAEVPPPTDDGEHVRELRKSERRVFVRHTVMPAGRALEWYLRCRRGDAVLPTDDGTLPAPGDEQARRLRLLDLGEEPPWPSLALAVEQQQEVPFVPAWHGQPRMHHMIPLIDLDLKTLWPRENECRNAVDFLSETLHFDLDDYPEFWGSVHLLAPNPLFRKMEGRRLPTSTEHIGQMLYRLHPRAGKDLTGLELAIDEQRASGECSTTRVALEGPLIRVTFRHKIGRFREGTRDPLRGLLHTRHTVVLAGLTGRLSIGENRKRVVPVPATPRRAAEEYEVATRRTEGQTIKIGSTRGPHVPGAESRIWAAQRARKAQDAVRSLSERLFDDDVQEATDILRSLLNEARREVLIIDPYFARPELVRFALAVGQIDAPISILTSAEVLKAMDPSSNNMEKGDVLHAEIQNLATQKDINTFKIRVMPGERPIIHDRFLVVDDRIWLLGSSFNEFASRGTMIISLSHPELVRDKLRQAWNDAEELASWLHERHASRIVKSPICSTPQEKCS